ncbi:MAG: hypothetical protein R3F61_12785 [Myxococcota bacterium]
MWWVLASMAGGPCDSAALSVVLGALESVPDERVAELTASDLADACTFEPPVQDALLQVAAGDPSGARDPRSLDPLLDHPTVRELCGVTLASTDRADVWSTCELARMGAFTEQGWREAQGPVLLPLVVHEVLVASGTSRDTAQIVVRRLAGIPREARGGVVNVFEPLFPTFP